MPNVTPTKEGPAPHEHEITPGEGVKGDKTADAKQGGSVSTAEFSESETRPQELHKGATAPSLRSYTELT